MLLLSRGLLVSFRDLLDAAGFDIRVIAAQGSMVHRAADRPMRRRWRDAIARLPDVRARRAGTHRQRAGDRAGPARPGRRVSLVGTTDAAAGGVWTHRPRIVAAAPRRRAGEPPPLVVSPSLASRASPRAGIGAAAAPVRARHRRPRCPLVTRARRRHRRLRLRSGRRRHRGDDDGGVRRGAGRAGERRRGNGAGRRRGPAPAPCRGRRDRASPAGSARPLERSGAGAVQPERASATSARSRRCCRR